MNTTRVQNIFILPSTNHPWINTIFPISCCCHSTFCFHIFDYSEEVEPLRLCFWIWFVSFSLMFCRFIGVVCYTSPQINTMPASPPVWTSQYWHYKHVLPHPAINVGALGMNSGPYACPANAPLNEPSLQSQINIFFKLHNMNKCSEITSSLNGLSVHYWGLARMVQC